MSYEFDLFVIGAGSGGVRAARFAAGFGAKVAVAESRYLGGTCVNVGCVPKKLLVYGAHFAEEFEQASGFGWTLGASSFDWSTLIANKDREINRLNGIYRNLLVNSGVTLLEGHATLTGPNEVLVNGQRHTAKHILIATGGWPQIPEIPGHEHAISSNEAFFLKALPKRVLVVGGGYIAVEFAGIFQGLGAETSCCIAARCSCEASTARCAKHLHEELLKRGMDVQFNADIARIDKQPDGSLKATLKDGRVLEADCVFYATGRRPMLDNLGLETHEGQTRQARLHVERQ
jgi:glutathione reductase (NADPH)